MDAAEGGAKMIWIIMFASITALAAWDLTLNQIRRKRETREWEESEAKHRKQIEESWRILEKREAERLAAMTPEERQQERDFITAQMNAQLGGLGGYGPAPGEICPTCGKPR